MSQVNEEVEASRECFAFQVLLMAIVRTWRQDSLPTTTAGTEDLPPTSARTGMTMEKVPKIVCVFCTEATVSNSTKYDSKFERDTSDLDAFSQNYRVCFLKQAGNGPSRRHK